jgi:hypothetical protein
VYYVLVGGLEHFLFSIYWEFHHPSWLSYFSEGFFNHQPVCIHLVCKPNVEIQWLLCERISLRIPWSFWSQSDHHHARLQMQAPHSNWHTPSWITGISPLDYIELYGLFVYSPQKLNGKHIQTSYSKSNYLPGVSS